MSNSSGGALPPDPTKPIVTSNRPARFAFAPAGGFRYPPSSPPNARSGWRPGRAGIVNHEINPL